MTPLASTTPPRSAPGLPDSPDGPDGPSGLDEAQAFSLRLLAQLYLRLGAYDKAERALKALMAAAGPDPGCLGQLACAEMELGRPEEALACLEALEANGPPEPGIKAAAELARARALWRLGRLEEAGRARDKYVETVSKEAGEPR
jgi:tetratricopeptide (TPR) repeat protein